MVKDGIPFVGVPLIAGLGFLFVFWPIAVACFVLAAFMAYFFRDPHREIPEAPGQIVSAADGRVTRIEETPERKVVSVFLSPLDVHINRSPITGTIKKIIYTVGKKGPATNDESSLLNERNSLVIEGEGITMTCTQIAGIVARRIVCWPREGDNLLRGQKFGLIKFGSRTDLVMPASVELKVKIGDRVVGGETIIATHAT